MPVKSEELRYKNMYDDNVYRSYTKDLPSLRIFYDAEAKERTKMDLNLPNLVSVLKKNFENFRTMNMNNVVMVNGSCKSGKSTLVTAIVLGTEVL